MAMLVDLTNIAVSTAGESGRQYANDFAASLWYPSGVSRVQEKDFYLDAFRRKTLVIAADRDALALASPRRKFAAVIEELVANRARVVVVLGAESGSEGALIRTWLGLPATARARRSPLGGRAPRGDVVAWDSLNEAESLDAVWRVLRGRDLCLLFTSLPSLPVAGVLAQRFRALKLVLIDREGGLRATGKNQPLSYLDGSRLEVLLSGGEAEFQGLGEKRDDLAAIAELLDAGVGSVNLCRAADLGRELFTYEGSGTFFSRDDHLEIGRLSIDDFAEVERLLAHGQSEGLLKPRSVAEVGALLFEGYGAWIGAHQLGGVGSLRRESFAGDGAGEIAGLYAITRFQGEGIGQRLVQRMLRDARSVGLSYVFSVTTAERAAMFFHREGFREVDPDELPPSKWVGYDPRRRRQVRAFRFDLRG